jgi:hypothetical protein
MTYGGYPRFLSNGYWITMLAPWPVNWGNDGYGIDDVYIVSGNDSHSLYNRSYPGFGIAISISRSRSIRIQISSLRATRANAAEEPAVVFPTQP